MTSLRQRIADAAQELYLSEGLGGFSMRRVADLVGVSAPAIYRHYASKDELLSEIVIQGLKVLEDYLRPAFESATPYERLRGMTHRYLDFALEQPKYFDFAFLIPNPEMSHVSVEISRPDLSTFRRAIEQVGACMKDGSFAPGDPLETAIILWAEVHGLITLYRTGRFGQDEEYFRSTYCRVVDRLLLGLKSS